MIKPVLRAAGLNEKEAQIYEQILRNGKSTASLLLHSVPVKRGDLYNVLRRLEDRKFIYSLPGSKKLTYAASDPETIEHALKNNEQNIEDAKENLPLVYSLYNLGVGKPGVRFAQGLDGIKKMFNDTLNTKTEILSFADVDGWLAHLEKYTKWYGNERRIRGVKERVIIPDTPVARTFISSYDKRVTRVKFIPHETFKFSLEMNIYDNKVLYVTLREPFIAVLIEDKSITDTQRSIFELSWLQTAASTK